MSISTLFPDGVLSWSLSTLTLSNSLMDLALELLKASDAFLSILGDSIRDDP